MNLFYGFYLFDQIAQVLGIMNIKHDFTHLFCLAFDLLYDPVVFHPTIIIDRRSSLHEE